MLINSAYSITNITLDTITTRNGLVLNPNEPLVIYLNALWHLKHGSIVVELINSGQVKGIDIWGVEMTPDDSVTGINEVCARAIKLNLPDAPNPDRNGYASQVMWNMLMKEYLIPIVRSDMLYTGLSQFGMSGITIAQKLGSVINFMLVGQFKEAAQVLQAITPDAYLTTELLTKYRNMLTSADAIMY